MPTTFTVLADARNISLPAAIPKQLTIKGKRGSTNSGLKLVRGESHKEDFLRVFTLGEALDTSNVNAKLDIEHIVSQTITTIDETVFR